jgi:serine/threonine protein kinase
MTAQGAPAEMFGRYRLLGRLATGGMAEVWAAQLHASGGFVKSLVIKRVLPALLGSPQFMRMFVDEARVAARLSHANVCAVYELGDVAGEYYMAMEYLRGAPLTRVIEAGGPLSPDLAVAVLAQACDGLHYAHEQRDASGQPLNLVHRDVSPHNLFATVDGVVKLLDFGIAKVDDSSDRTEAGKVKGKLPYMSPEQVMGHRLDRRTDVWSLGAVLFELLTGNRLFARSAPAATVDAIRSPRIPPLASHGVLGAAKLDEVLGRALCPNREWRYATAAELKRAMLEAVRPGGAASNDQIAQMVLDRCGEHVAAGDRLFEDSDPHNRRLPLPPEPALMLSSPYLDVERDDGDDYDVEPTVAMDSSDAHARSMWPNETSEIDGPTVALDEEETVSVAADEQPTRAGRPASDAERRGRARSEPRPPTPSRSTAAVPAVLAGRGTGGVSSLPLQADESVSRKVVLPPRVVAPADGDLDEATVRQAPPEPARVPRGTPPEAQRPRRLDVGGDPGRRPPAAVGTPRSEASVMTDAVAPIVPAKRRRWPYVLVAAALIGGAIRVATHRGAPAPVAAPAPAVAAAPVVTAPPAAEVPIAVPTPEPAVTPAPEPAPVVRPSDSTARPSRPRPPRPAPAPALRKDAPPGRLFIDAAPWATIYLDGQRLGVTPLVGVSVPSGPHTLKAVAEDGRTQVMRVDVGPDGEVRRKIRW